MNKNAIVVENYVDPHCHRHLHLMANSSDALPFVEKGIITQEAGVWHLRAEYPYRGVLDVECVGNHKKFRRLVVHSLDGCGSVRDAIHAAFTFFWATFRFQPGYVFMKKLPSGVENGQDFEGMVLVEADWMLERCVAVGGRQ